MSVYVHQKTYTAILIIAPLSIKAEGWKQPRCPSTQEQLSKFVVYVYSEVLLSHKKEQTTNAHKNMDESQKYKIEWKQPDTREYILNDPMIFKNRENWSMVISLW